MTLPAAGPAGSGSRRLPDEHHLEQDHRRPQRGRAAVRVSCPLGCKGRLSLEVSGSRRDPPRTRAPARAPGIPGLRRGGIHASGRVRLPYHMRLDRYARHFLAHHHGHLTAELSTDGTDPETTASIGHPVKILSQTMIYGQGRRADGRPTDFVSRARRRGPLGRDQLKPLHGVGTQLGLPGGLPLAHRALSLSKE